MTITQTVASKLLALGVATTEVNGCLSIDKYSPDTVTLQFGINACSVVHKNKTLDFFSFSVGKTDAYARNLANNIVECLNDHDKLLSASRLAQVELNRIIDNLKLPKSAAVSKPEEDHLMYLHKSDLKKSLSICFHPNKADNDPLHVRVELNNFLFEDMMVATNLITFLKIDKNKSLLLTIF